MRPRAACFHGHVATTLARSRSESRLPETPRAGGSALGSETPAGHGRRSERSALPSAPVHTSWTRSRAGSPSAVHGKRSTVGPGQPRAALRGPRARTSAWCLTAAGARGSPPDSLVYFSFLISARRRTTLLHSRRRRPHRKVRLRPASSHPPPRAAPDGLLKSSPQPQRQRTHRSQREGALCSAPRRAEVQQLRSPGTSQLLLHLVGTILLLWETEAQ